MAFHLILVILRLYAMIDGYTFFPIKLNDVTILLWRLFTRGKLCDFLNLLILFLRIRKYYNKRGGGSFLFILEDLWHRSDSARSAHSEELTLVWFFSLIFRHRSNRVLHFWWKTMQNLDPVGSTVCYEVMKLFTWSV